MRNISCSLTLRIACVGAVREPPLLLFFCFLCYYFYIKGLSAFEK